jgi:hypothetical protein
LIVCDPSSLGAEEPLWVVIVDFVFDYESSANIGWIKLVEARIETVVADIGVLKLTLC